MRDEYGEHQSGESAVELLSDSSGDEAPAGPVSLCAAPTHTRAARAAPAAPAAPSSVVVISSSDEHSEHSAEDAAGDAAEDTPAAGVRV